MSQLGRGHKKATDEQLIQAYQDLGNVWEVGKFLGMCGQSVHERLKKLNVELKYPRYKEEHIRRLLDDYEKYANEGKLDILASEMGRKKSDLCAKARTLGLTNQKRERPYHRKWSAISIEEAVRIWDKFKSSSLNKKRFCQKHNYPLSGFDLAMRKYFSDEWDHVIELKTPKTTMYKLGRYFEYRVRDFLKAQGFYVIRSPQSRSPFDLIAIKPNLILAIQCKKFGYFAPKEWNEFYGLCLSIGASPIVAYMENVKLMKFKRIMGLKTGNRKDIQPWEDFVISLAEEPKTIIRVERLGGTER